MILKLNLFWKELFLFAAALAVGIFSAHNYAPLVGKEIVRSSSFTRSDIIIFTALFITFSFILLRFKKLSAISLKFFLILVVFSGSQIVVGSFIKFPWELISGLAVILFFIFARNVLIHDLGILLGIAGVASLLGITVSPEISLILLIILSFYDIIAVYWTKHMVYIARGMIESGSIFGFIIPFNIGDFFYNRSEARQKIGEKFMILGSGDVGLPLIMASSLTVISLQQAIVTSIFSLIGLFITHLIFVNQKSRKPMAALPPIATLTIVGYLVTIAIK